MKPDLPQRLLNEHEVSNICAIQVATLRKWRTLRRGPRFLKIGALVRYRPDDISAWFERQAAIPCDEAVVASSLHEGDALQLWNGDGAKS